MSHAANFATPITMTGPLRSPAQLLADQSYDGHVSVHDEAAAAALGLTGAPIEGPTHLSQFEPFGAMLWGRRWFEQGCISAHFQTMVVEGQQVQAIVEHPGGAGPLQIRAVRDDGAQVLSGTLSIGPDHGLTELDRRLNSLGDPGVLHIVDRVEVGMRLDETSPVSVTFDDDNGQLYPFSLRRKLDTITEPHPWFEGATAGESPWGRAVLPFEMLSVLTQKQGPSWPVRSPALGLFLDLEVRMLAGPVFADYPYLVRREVGGRSQSRRVESYWTRSVVVDPETGIDVCAVVLHQGVFKDSYPGYPAAA
jgi:hypothetical protein